MENKSNKFINALKAFEWGYAALFAVLVALGVLSFCFHDMLKWVVFAAGAIIAAFGVGYGIYTLISKTRGATFVIRIIIFASAIVAGAITMIFHAHGVEVLTSVLGTLFIIDGACKLQKTALLIRYRSVAWWMLIVPALLSVAGGFMLIKWGVITDESSTVFVAVLLGVTAIIDGISNILTPFLAPVLKKGGGDVDEAACETESEADNDDTGATACESETENTDTGAAVYENGAEAAEVAKEDAATENTSDATAEEEAPDAALDADEKPAEVATEPADSDNTRTNSAPTDAACDAPLAEEETELATEIGFDATEAEADVAADAAEAENASATATDKPQDE